MFNKVKNRQIESPIKPNLNQFNFDTDEFSRGEKEFNKRIEDCQKEEKLNKS